MFAIIDIETCGGKFIQGRGRITEICILIHDGLSVVNRMATLLNPECYITEPFTRITGITNAMVANAPKFYEVAEKIVKLTEGCVFVAHNVSFDYNFIREEFNALGYTYKRDTLCTVRLSRKLIPGKASYSLGNLCESLGIPLNNRHRAEGDADATALLFDLLLRYKNNDPKYKNLGVDELMVRKVDKIKQYALNKLPEACGVYYFLNQAGEIIYTGKSTDMYKRAQSHFTAQTKKSREMLFELHDVDFVETGSELIALLHEAEEIKRHQGKYNRMRKDQNFDYCLSTFVDANGIINFKISPSEEAETALVTLTKYSAARALLDQWIDSFELCMRYCGLSSADAVCFHHQIKKCKGICNDQEDKLLYNARAEKLLSKYLYASASFVILDKGRHSEENALIFVRDGRYAGYGYIEKSEAIQQSSQLWEYLIPKKYYPDCDLLIRSYLLKYPYLKTYS